MIKPVGGLASLVATYVLAVGVEFQYHKHEFTVTRTEVSVVNNVRMTMMIAECSKTGKFMFIIHKERMRTGVTHDEA